VTGTVLIGAIAPHSDLAIAEACSEEMRDVVPDTQRAMAEVGRRIAESAPDAIVVATPHNVHVTGHMSVLTSSRVAGGLEDTAQALPLAATVDRELALGVLDRMNADGIPTVGVSFGGNVPAEAVSPLDWGTHVPLWHVAQHANDLPPVVVVAPARDLHGAAHVEAGRSIVRAASTAGRRIAFVASADQGHGHSADGPYGFAPESATFDARIRDIVERDALDELLPIGEDAARAAVVDSWWQMLMLHGALREDGGPFRSRFLAYDVAIYCGLLTALFEPAA
jgi:aromatic ring-opening dioxygenase LigB subunit